MWRGIANLSSPSQSALDLRPRSGFVLPRGHARIVWSTIFRKLVRDAPSRALIAIIYSIVPYSGLMRTVIYWPLYERCLEILLSHFERQGATASPPLVPSANQASALPGASRRLLDIGAIIVPISDRFSPRDK